MHGKSNGGRVVLVDGDGCIHQTEDHEARRERARVMATGAFRGHVASVAAKIAGGMIGSREVAIMNDAQRDAFAREAVDLARRLVIEAHKCEMPAGAELEG